MNAERNRALLKRLAPHRDGWGPRPPEVTPEPVGVGEESVWDYPRPPVLRPAPGRVMVRHRGVTIADTTGALEMCETASAAVPYIPPADVAMDHLKRAAGTSLCEWKGEAIYFDVIAGGSTAQRAAFAYPHPLDDLDLGYSRIAGWIAFHPAVVDEAWIDGMRAAPQPGGLYAGWVTPRIKGPVKGAPGTGHW
ncbi:DUF427 domain-containing protein [Maricaulaceae bacterium MS644]